MEPLFLAVIGGCKAGLFHETLREVYIPRIQRGDASFAANVLGARGPLLTVLAHFFEHGRWGSSVQTGVGRQTLTAEDQLFILMQAGLYLTATRGLGASEALICYKRAESLCHSLNRPQLLYSTLIGQWRYSLMTDKLSATMDVAKRVYSLAQEQSDAALTIGAYRALSGSTLFGRFPILQTKCDAWSSDLALGRNPVSCRGSPHARRRCLYFGGLSEWHLGEVDSCHRSIVNAISLAKELKDMNALAVALNFAAYLAHYERNPIEVERLASE